MNEENLLIQDEKVEGATKRAQDITDSAKQRYKIEVERLKLFNARWNAFVNKTVKEYPSDKTRKLVALSEMITEILSKDETFEPNEKKIEDIYKLIENEGTSLEEKPSLFGKSESGFDMEEVLNPKGELDLMSLCKELGVTD